MVLLDEASQMIEPASLLAVARYARSGLNCFMLIPSLLGSTAPFRFSARRLLALGDPLQVRHRGLLLVEIRSELGIQILK